ncbi:MAG: HEPN domain-containing protein [Hymenobacter sp.]|nr:MAG: HEPN domain-containing protein [Hymenobacter sp.]
MQPGTPTPKQKRVAMSLLTADRDMEAAEALLQVGAHLYENIGFHCQQVVEKYLKGVLVAYSLPAVDLRYETDDAPAYTSADVLAMAHRFRAKLRPLAQAFLT